MIKAQISECKKGNCGSLSKPSHLTSKPSLPASRFNSFSILQEYHTLEDAGGEKFGPSKQHFRSPLEPRQLQRRCYALFSLGYVSSDIADPDPITPNCLLMGWRDSSLPQAIYEGPELLG